MIMRTTSFVVRFFFVLEMKQKKKTHSLKTIFNPLILQNNIQYNIILLSFIVCRKKCIQKHWFFV